MSDESATSPEPASTPTAGTAPRARRISNPRPKKKTAKVANASDGKSEVVDEAVTPAVRKASKFPEFPETVEAAEVPASRGDWPEPEAASSGAGNSPESPKRKRRRKKGKGNGAQNAAPQVEVGNVQPAVDEPANSSQPQPQAQPPRPQNQVPRPKLDAEILTKCAWKIYLAEISEEGVALVGDNDAKELSRRCFRLAEIFMEEQARHR